MNTLMKSHQFSTALSQNTTQSNGKPLRFPSPAKLNLFLYINGKLPNGYHELQTLFQFLDFGDWLEMSIREEDNQILLTPEIPNLKTEDNLIYRAAKLLQEKANIQFGANIHLDKILPMGGGVGGGSSNAATTLVALNYLWQANLSIDKLAKLGLTLGADVPIFVHGHAAFAEGVGEKITYCEPAEKWFVVLKPNDSISTAVIFQDPNLPRNTPKKFLEQLLSEPYVNDCEKVVINHYSNVEKALNWLLQYAPARLTGTGACVFAEFDHEAEAQAVFRQKPEEFFGFIAKGLNVSPLHAMLKQLSPILIDNLNLRFYKMPDIKLFAGNATPELAKHISERLYISLGDATVGRFSDGEIQVQINENVRGADVFIIQSTCAPTNDNLMELIVMVDALRRASAGRITAVVPYFGYARQDRRVRSARVPITAKVVADLLSTVGIDRLLTCDLHAEQIQGFFDVPVDNVFGSPVLIHDILKKSDLENPIVVSPDIGGVVRARAVAKLLNDTDMAIIDKRRPRANVAQVMHIIGDVAGRDCILVDDMIDTGGTLCKAAEALKERGAKRVFAYATHAVFSGAAAKNLASGAIDEIVVTDTIPLSEEIKALGRVRVLTLSAMLAEAIRRISNEESISAMFN